MRETKHQSQQQLKSFKGANSMVPCNLQNIDEYVSTALYKYFGYGERSDERQEERRTLRRCCLEVRIRSAM